MEVSYNNSCESVSSECTIGLCSTIWLSLFLKSEQDAKDTKRDEDIVVMFFFFFF